MMYLLGVFLICLTTIVHTIVTKQILNYLNRIQGRHIKPWLPNSYWTSVIVLILLFASLIESGIWAVAYYQLDVLDNFEECLYFSLVSYTTLGFGDVVLSDHLRILPAIEAANGIILFGWSTAIVVAVVQRIYFRKNLSNLNKI